MLEAAEFTKHDNYWFPKSMHERPNTAFDFDLNKNANI